MTDPGFGFLRRPGRDGPFGALMDEYARAAEDFCRAIEALAPEIYRSERRSDDPDTTSIRKVCAHVVGSARIYADYIRQAPGMPSARESLADPEALPEPASVRPALAAATQYTEESLAGWYEDPAPAEGVKFAVRSGPAYDPEMILEHAVVHLLRHRRQIERWPS